MSLPEENLRAKLKALKTTLPAVQEATSATPATPATGSAETSLLDKLRSLKPSTTAIKPQSHGATGSWEPLWPSRDTGPSLTDVLPTWHDVPAGIGAAVGTALGSPGGPPGMILGAGAGASAGESIYQLGQHLFGSPEAPKTTEEALSRQIPPLMMGPLEGVPFLARYAAEHPGMPALRRTLVNQFGPLKRSSQTLLTRGLNPSDKFFQEHIEQGLSELKDAERTMGPIRNVKKAQAGLDRQSQTYNTQIKEQIVNPQASVTVPGSRDAMVQAQVEAIPEDVRLHDIGKYNRLVEKIGQRAGDYTIGELNTLRSELGNRDSLYYGKDLSGQLTMDASDRAIEIARGNAARRLFYHSLDNAPGALGGGEAAAEINSRIGSIIHMKDALLPNVNPSVAQVQPVGARVLHKVGQLSSPAGLRQIAKGTKRTVDQDLALAVNRWRGLPEPVKINLEPRVTGIAGTQEGLPFVPENIGGINIGPKGEYLTPEAEYLQLQRQRKLWKSAQPIPEPGQQGIPFVPPDIGGEQLGAKGTYPSAEQEFRQIQQQRQLWREGQPRPTPGQMDLLTTEHGGGATAPPKLFGINQTPFKWEPSARETYTLQDLQSMSREIQDYLQTQNPPMDTRRKFAKDIADIQREIYRRQQAHKVGKSQ